MNSKEHTGLDPSTKPYIDESHRIRHETFLRKVLDNLARGTKAEPNGRPAKPENQPSKYANAAVTRKVASSA